MGITYKNENNAARNIEPIFTRQRTKYRSYRSSEFENSECNSFKIDISRISARLNSTESNLSEYLKYLNGDSSDITESTNLNDGLSYSINGVKFLLDNNSPSLEDLELDTVSKMGSRVFRLMNKISRLEKE
jgi:hypothetical protein